MSGKAAMGAFVSSYPHHLSFVVIDDKRVLQDR